ncbi:hypothetical protein OEZ85_010235 [Tetradesmus obliquus]|uniref:ABC transporter domain-containing protein n=1 Tax=Tetradesmus obliquus TaxID=3088 RepID=A0ABY8TRE6_TETOB|nr:hypothetical protein OEZ85_010235 [Tetradesmus obliquus]
MQALLGPSGAGKSSLLDILAQRKATGAVAGSLLLDGQPVTRSAYSRRIAYVPQDDNFSPIMTSLEVLAFHAAMQLPGVSSSKQIEACQLQGVAVCAGSSEAQQQQQQQQQQKAASKRHSRVGELAVQEVLNTVGLSKHASTLVGGRLPGGLLLRGLSSGERRRLSIAVGVLASPSILFLDEPTSGLDSFAALSVMSHLQGLAHASRKAVVAAIHQPRSAIWSLFDKVTLLASGLLIYHGPTSGMVPWLSGQLGYSYEPAAQGLASDWALDLVVVEFAKPGAFHARTMTTLAELQAAANTFKLQYVCDQLYADERQQQQQQEAGRLLTFTWVALLVGLIYYDLPTDAGSIRQRLNLLFATLCFFVLMPFVNMSLYTEDKGSYLADRAAGLYAPSAYYAAKVTSTVPFSALTALCAGLVQYGMTGMRPGADHIFGHCSIGVLTFLIAVQVLHLSATLTPSQDASFMLGIGWTTFNLVLSGFFIPYKEIRFAPLANLRFLSALHYAFEGMVQIELGGRRFACPAAGLDSQSAAFLTQLLPGAASLLSPSRLQQAVGAQQGCAVDSSAVAAYFGMSRRFGTTIGILLGYLGLMHAATFAALLLVARRERR